MVSDEPSHTIEEGRIVDIVAQKVGFKSGWQYERAHCVLNKMYKCQSLKYYIERHFANLHNIKKHRKCA